MKKAAEIPVEILRKAYDLLGQILEAVKTASEPIYIHDMDDMHVMHENHKTHRNIKSKNTTYESVPSELLTRNSDAEEVLQITGGMWKFFKESCPNVDPVKLRNLWHNENQATGWVTARGSPITDRAASLRRYALTAEGMIRNGKPHPAKRTTAADTRRWDEYNPE